MAATAQALENLTITFVRELHVAASLAATFDALLEQLGPANEVEPGRPMPMVLEAWPGGRWYRDLGAQNGHFWANVQAIKRPTLLELWGPLFMSLPAVSNVQYRLKEEEGGTLLTLRHSSFGPMPEDYREGMAQGFDPLLDRIKKHAEQA